MKFNFKKRKKIAGIAILAISILLSAYLIFGPFPSSERKTGILIVGTTTPIQNPYLIFQTNPLENLTLDFANKTFENATKNNLYQSNGNSPSVLPPDTSDIQKTISQIIDDEYATEVVTSSDITVGTDDSKGAQMLYLLYMNQVISDIPTYGASSTPSADLNSTFTAAAQNFDTAVGLLEMVKVPPSWVDIHRQILTLLIHQRNVFESLAKSGDDPLRFMIALYQGGSSEFDAIFSQIQAEVNQKIRDEKLI